MDLFKWKSNLKPVFPNIIEKFFGKKISDNTKSGEEISTVPSVNISEQNKAFEVNIALPGIDRKDIQVEVRNNCLIISSEKQYNKEEKNTNWIRQEFGFASFQRMFELPEMSDPDRIEANLKNGLLTIKVGKKKDYENKIKQIPVA